MRTEEIAAAARQAVEIILESRQPKAGEILVVGCSTSEIIGRRIGSASSEEAAGSVMAGVVAALEDREIYLAVQGCEHINRALSVPRDCMERYGLQEVWVKPWLHAGGAFATEAFERLPDRVMVEDLRGMATMGMDIGGTLIGMHMHPVVVPIHTDLRKVGEATLLLARSRPKYVGGPRAQYEPVPEAHH